MIAYRPRVTFTRILALMLVVLAVVIGGSVYAIVQLVTTDGSAFASRSSTNGADNAATALPPAPPVEPVRYLDVPRDAARTLNAAIPFSTAPNPPAAPFIVTLPATDYARAVDCLAAAAWYEAGDDGVGEEAVIQVVLNRLRHRAFAKSVCGVVFSGAERSTGCQFSFACDGSLRRTPSAAAWGRAQTYARAALNGFVFARVGYATHYHTDWVVPNWNTGVEKIAAVDTHLFFRWPGANGSPVAFRERHAGTEPFVPTLARLSPAHAAVAAAPTAGSPVPAVIIEVAPQPVAFLRPVDGALLRGTQLQEHDGSANLFVLTIKPDDFAGTLALVALDLCKAGDDKGCTVVGFAGTAARIATSVTGQVSWPERRPDFYYYRDPSRGREIAMWNCKTFPRPAPRQCMADDFVATR